MAKYNRNKVTDELEEVQEEKEVVATPVKSTYNYGVKRVQSLLAARIVFKGNVTGHPYEWPQAGSVVLVDERDVPELLEKRLGGRSCCGGSDANRIFALI